MVVVDCPASGGIVVPFPAELPVPSRWRILRLAPVILIASALSAPAQVRGRDIVAGLCAQPPMEAAAIQRLKRRADYGRLLDGLADHCPEVAMVFLAFEIGVVDGRGAATEFDPYANFPPLGWPSPADRNF